MSARPDPAATTWMDWLSLAARVFIGGLFVWMGATKIADPVGFLKLLREYDWLTHPLVLNMLAAWLPWMELVCGVLVIGGIRLRGAALVALGMLVPFTVAVAERAWGIHGAQGIPFCGIRFDCGCGAGEVWICRKLLENTLLIFAAAWLVWVPSNRWRLGRT